MLRGILSWLQLPAFEPAIIYSIVYRITVLVLIGLTCASAAAAAGLCDTEAGMTSPHLISGITTIQIYTSTCNRLRACLLSKIYGRAKMWCRGDKFSSTWKLASPRPRIWLEENFHREKLQRKKGEHRGKENKKGGRLGGKWRRNKWDGSFGESENGDERRRIWKIEGKNIMWGVRASLKGNRRVWICLTEAGSCSAAVNR